MWIGPDITNWVSPVELGAPSFDVEATNKTTPSAATPHPPLQGRELVSSRNGQESLEKERHKLFPSLEGGTAAGGGVVLDGDANRQSSGVSSGLDPKLLLSLLGSGNPQLAPVMGLLNGEKPDIMSLLPTLLPLLTQMSAKKSTAPPAPTKEATPPPPLEKTISLADYSTN